MIRLVIDEAVGYMLKVMRSGTAITKYKDEFNAIRHGDYDEFISLVKGEKPIMIVWQEGTLANQDNISQKTHFDMIVLISAQNSLQIFLNNCVKEYGEEFLKQEPEISNDIYRKTALFEVSLRIHANNNKIPINKREDLVDVIIKLSNFKGLSPEEIEKLQKGRQFLNDIKHHNNKPNYKRKFSTWEEGVSKFKEAYKILEEKELFIGEYKTS
jgi:hypothetical protein